RFPGSELATTYASVKTIKATGRYTVRVTLKHPDASLPYWLGDWPAQIFEKRFQQAHKTTFGQPGTLVMGTGPWIPGSLDPPSGEELRANPRYWRGKVPIEHISIKFLSDENSKALAFRAGELDVVPDVAAPTSFAATAATKLISVPSCQSGWFA